MGAGLFAARLVYAYSWYNIGAVLPLVQSGLGASTAALGIVLGVFLVGVGVFQIPAGFVALRYGSRATSLFGLVLMGASATASAFAPNVVDLAVCRFATGVGAAFFFAPGLALVSRYFPAGERGPVIGLYNGAFSLGGALGLFGGALAGLRFGWPFALGVGGVLLLASAAVLARTIPPDPPRREREDLGALWRRGAPVLRSRSVWALAFALTGFWGAVYVVAQYFVQFGHDVHPEWSTGLTAAVAAAVVLASFPGGPVGGALGERARDRRRVVLLYTVLTGGIVLLVPFVPLPVLAPALVVLGFFDGLVFAVQYLMPSYFAEARDEALALGVGFLNSVQVLVGSGIAIAFGYLIAPDGWSVAWVFAGLACLATLPLLIFVEPPSALDWNPRGRPPDAGPGSSGSPPT